MIKMIFSKYCASGFYGEKKCRCKRCCEKFNKFYSEIDEKRDWIYSKVMKGKSFIVDNVSIIDLKSNPMNFDKRIKAFVEIKKSKKINSDNEWSGLLGKIDWNLLDKIKGYYEKELENVSEIKEINYEYFKELINSENDYKFFIKSQLNSHLNSEALTYLEFSKKVWKLSTSVKDLNMNIIDVWVDANRGKEYLNKFNTKFIEVNNEINQIYLIK
jgi:hypothetical protein